MIESQKQFRVAQSASDKEFIQQKIDALDRQIDKIVYMLYGLSDDEMRVLEDNV